MTPDDEDVRTLTADACQTVLGLSVCPAGGPAPAPGARLLLGRVVVTGAWQGAVTLACTPAFARQAAALMFDAAGGASPEDVRDALGELTNIIGGGIKGLMPSPSRLSLPVVVEAEGLGGDAPGPAREVWFYCSGEHFVVAVSPAPEPRQDQGLPP